MSYIAVCFIFQDKSIPIKAKGDLNLLAVSAWKNMEVV
jgi:hypothetical protein